jgi:N-acetylglucosamine kinase-like BadF-type ATPase
MDRERALGMLGEVFPNARARAESDAAAAFYAAELKPDVCVIAGTGSLVCSEGPNGLIRSGGRGYLLGDEGSAFRLGRSFVRAYLDDPKDVSERVKSEMVDAFGTTEPAEIVAALYKLPAPVQALAKFAKVLGEELKDGNARWHGIAVTEASELATVAADHAKRYLPMAPKLRVSLAGGVWKILGMSEAFTLALTEKLSESVIKVEVSRRPPVLGAVALAMEIQLGN